MMTARRINDFPEDLGEEATQFTEGMRDLVYRLVARRGVSVVDGGAELRVETPEGVFAFMGQPLSRRSKTGAHPARVQAWREMGVPVFFVAVMGDIGWVKRVTARTEKPKTIDKMTGHERVGWQSTDMLKVAFSTDALMRHETRPQPAVPWEWNRPAADEPEGLFDGV